MKVTILNGNPDEKKYPMQSYLTGIREILESRNHQICQLNLREMKLEFCHGCWGCWVKTPGECLFSDDSQIIRREVINSDFVLLASPLMMGFTSALLKKAMDKLIPLIHPYILLDQKECHHQARYEKYPLIGVVTSRGLDADDGDLEITRELFERFSLNFKSRLAFFETTEKPVQEAVDEIGSL